jgi:hypothetical protein
MPNGGHGLDSARGAEETASAVSNITLTNAQFRELLEAVTTSATAAATRQNSENHNETFQGSSTHQVGSFTNCSHRFDGSPSADVEAFINCILVFKDCANVSDANALKGFAILLTDLAATWWNGIKHSIETFDDAVNRLRNAFGRKKPAHQIFREIFATEQNAKKTDIFICETRSLFAQLPYRISDEMQIDMIFELLSLKIRKRLACNSIRTFDELLQKAREAEETFEEEERERLEVKTSHTPQTDDKQKRPERPRCSYCKKFGHEKKECRKWKRDSDVQNSQKVSDDQKVKAEASDDKPTISCYGCGAPGVIKSNCANCRAKSQSSAQSLDIFSVEPELNMRPVRPRERPLLLVNICNFDGYAYVDTCAKQSVAGYRLYQKMKSIKQEFLSTTMKVTLADGVAKSKEVLYTTVTVKVESRHIPITFIVFPDAKDNDTLLGVDFVEDAKIIIDVPNKKWQFSDDLEKAYDLKFENSFKEKIERNLKVFSVEPLRNNEGTTLSQEEKGTLNRLLSEYDEIFGPSQVPTPFAEHKIDTGRSAPIAMPAYQMTKQRKEILKNEIEKMLKDDVIEPCESPWASPVVLVPKNDNSWRVCIDYRKLNSVTKADKYPLPRIEELLHLAKQTLYMTTIDLKSGYWQISVRESDRDKTCFTSPCGTFRFKRMPFGLKNSGATFQRLIDRFRNGLNDIAILAYLDDLIIVSPSFQKHISDLKQVFERLKHFGLRANRSKCCFARESINYLGHVITKDGIRVNPLKVEAIVKMIPPNNVKKLKSFIQMCSWFRRFVPDFSDVARPLTDLLKKNATWNWSTRQQAAFDDLKKFLTTAPVLRQADETLPFKIRTDASNYALGAVLLQGEGPEEKPIEYASRLLTPSERNYDTTQREALAVVWACKKFRGYIEGNEVIVSSDHQPLRWLMSLQSPTGRLARWALSLQPYDIKVNYIPGRSNVLADILSRPTIPDETDQSCELCPVEIEYPRLAARDMRKMQYDDAEVRKIIDSLEGRDKVNCSNWMDRGFIMNNGILYRYDPDDDQTNAQLVIPERERMTIFKENHDSPVAGHYGVEKTVQKIAAKYYWPGMRHDISKYVKGCLKCQRYKSSNLKPEGLLRTPPPYQRF